MSEQTILDRYTALLKAYALQPEEKLLAAAAELGREMVQADMSLEAISRIYVEALQRLSQERPDITLPDTLSLILPFLQQLMTASDLAHRKRLASSKQMVESLRQSAAEYRAIFETTGTAMLIIEEDTTISLLNTEGEKLYGYPREEVEGKRSWTEFVVANDLERMKEYHRLRRSDPSLAPQNYEFQLIDKHGTVKDVLLFIDMIPGTGKSVASLLDITQRNRTEKALKRRATQLATVAEIGRQMTTFLALDPLLEQVVTLIREAFGYRYVSLFLVDPAREKLVLRAGAGYEIEPAKAVHLKIGEEGICGWVAAHGKPLLVGDVSQEPRYYTLGMLADTCSELALPVRLKDQIIGVLDVQSDVLNAFDEEDTFVLQLLSDQVAVALENTRLFEAEQRRRQEAETLRKAALALTTSLERNQVIERILHQLQQVVPYNSASVQLLHGNQLEIIGGHGFPDPEKILGIIFDLAAEDIPNVKVMDSRAPLILKDAPANYDRFKQESRAWRIRSWLGVPLLVGDRAVGMLALDKHEPGFYTGEHAQLALAFAAQAAIAIENARLFQAEQEQRELAEALAEAAAAVGSTLDLDEVFARILEQVARVVPGDVFNIMLLEGDTVRAVRWRGYDRLGIEEQIANFTVPFAKYPNFIKMIESGETIFVPDTTAAPDWVMEAGQEWRRSYIGAPIQTGDATIGFLNADDTRAGQFSPADVQRLEAFAGHAAIAIQNARLYEQAQREIAERKQAEEMARRRGEELEALRDISLALTAQLKLDTLLQNIVERGCRLLGVRTGGLYLVDETRGDLELAISHGFTRDHTGVRLAPGEGLSGKVLQSGEPLAVKDYHHWEEQSPDWEVEPIIANLGVPLKRGKRVIGVLTFAELGQAKSFDEHDIWLAALFADQAAIAIQNARLYQQSQELIARITRLYELSIQINATLSLEEALELVVRQVLKAAEAHSAVINLLDQEGHLESHLGMGADGEPRGNISPPRSSGTTMSIYRTGVPLIANDLEEEDPRLHPSLRNKGIKAFIGLPLKTRERCTGVLFVRYVKPHSFSEEEVQALSLFANQAAVALENARLYHAEQLSRERADALREISRVVGSTLELDEVLSLVLRQAKHVLTYDTASILLFANDQPAMAAVIGYEDKEIVKTEVAMRLGDSPILQSMARDRQPILIADAREDERWIWVTGAEGVRAWIGAPLLVRDEMIGVLMVDSTQPGLYTAADVAIAQSLAGQVAVAIENARLYTLLEQEKARLELLHCLSHQLSESLDVHDVAQRALDELCGVVGAMRGITLVRELDSELLQLVAVSGYATESLANLGRRIGLGVGNGLIGQVVAQRQPELVANVLQNEHWAPVPGLDDGVRSALSVPLFSGDETIGAFSIYSDREDFFNDDHRRLAESVAATVAVAIQNARLYEQAQHRLEILNNLNRASQALTSSLEVQAVLEQIVELAGSVVNSDYTSVALLDEKGHLALEVEDFRGLPSLSRRLRPGGVTHLALESGQLVVMDEIAADGTTIPPLHHSSGELLQANPDIVAAGIRSAVALPIQIKEKTLGVLFVHSRTPRAFRGQLTLLSTFANQAAVALENARLYEQAQQEIVERERAQDALRRRATQLATLGEVGQQIASLLPLGPLLERIVNFIREAFAYRYVVILLVDPLTKTLELKAGAGFEVECVRPLGLKVGEEGICGWVAGSGEPLLVGDVSQEPRYYALEPLPDTRSELAVPIRVQDQVVGVLSVQSTELNAFDQADLFTLQTLADQTAVALENARLYEQAQQQARDLGLLYEIGRLLASSPEITKMLGQVSQRCTEVFDADLTLVRLITDDLLVTKGSYFCDPSDQETVEKLLATHPLHLGEGIVGRVAASGQPAIHRGEDVSRLTMPDYVAYLRTREWILVPMRSGKAIIGVLTLIRRNEKGPFLERDIMLAQGIADQTAVALENARLYEETKRHVKELTVLHNIDIAITSTLNLDEVLDLIVRQAAELLGAETLAIPLLSEDGSSLAYTAAYGRLAADLVGRVKLLGERGICTWVMRNKQAFYSDDLAADEHESKEMKEALGLRTVISAPMISKGKTIGAITAINKQDGGAFTRADLKERLQPLANQAAVAIENARLFEAEQCRRREAETLREAALALTTTLERSQVIKRILIQLREVVPYDSSSVQLLQDNQLEIIGGHGFPNLEELLGVTFDLTAEDNPNREVVHTQAPLILEDAPTAYSRFTREPHRQADIHSWLGVPMLIGDQPIGIITLDKWEPGFYTEEHARLAEAFAAQAAIAIENARLFEAEREQRELSESLVEAAVAIGGTLELEQVLDRLLEQVERVVPGDACNVMLIEEDVARAVRWRGYKQLGSEEFISTIAFRLSEVANLQQMVETGKPVMISDTATYPGWEKMPTQAWVRSYVSTPIQVGRVTVGFLSVDGTRPGQFDSADARRLEAFASHAAVAIENAELYRQLRKHAEQLEERVQERTAQLQAQYARLDALLRSVSDGILVTDAQGDLIQTNPVAQRWLSQTLSAGDAERLQTLVRNLARRAQERPEAVLELTRLDLQLNAAPIAEREAEEATTVVVAHDVSHIKALERMKSRFVTNVSHELRTPITTIKLYVALLQQKPEKWEQYLDALTQESEHLARLVEDVLQVSRIDNGRLEIHPRPTSLNAFTELIVSSHQVLAQSGGVTLSYQPAAPDSLALADPDQLTQALNNLVRNALHYTPEGGEVNVSTGTAERKGRLWATVTVADTGMGIPPEELPHIFKRFFRGQQPQSLQLSGSGLGLAIVHEIVELHGGRVTVDTQVGAGSTFTIWLPLLKE